MSAMKTRNIQLDIAKGLCLILMIGGHTKGIDPGLYHFIYSFHMPAFFVIAGMTYVASQSPKTDLVWSKFKRLIIPAWIFGAINGLPFLARLLRGGSTCRNLSIASSVPLPAQPRSTILSIARRYGSCMRCFWFISSRSLPADGCKPGQDSRCCWPFSCCFSSIHGRIRHLRPCS
jgi:fucose 4-O-acetylase-like acetyltransferase